MSRSARACSCSTSSRRCCRTSGPARPGSRPSTRSTPCSSSARRPGTRGTPGGRRSALLRSREADMYQWLAFGPPGGLVLLPLLHGVSLGAAFGVRSDPRPETARVLLGLSMRANQAMYLGLILLAIGGLAAAWNANQLTAGSIVASYVVLILVIVGMYA